MKQTSLARRIFRIIFAIGMINVVVTLVATEIIYEDVENTILRLELAEERTFLEQRIEGSQVQIWETALLQGVFVPDGMKPARMPALFDGLSAPLSAEIEVGRKTFLISIERTSQTPGVLYLAQDVTILEDREDRVQLTMIVLGLAMLLLGLLLARHGTRRVIQPLHMLTGEIAGIRPEANLRRIEAAYGDAELAAIARTLNELLSALDAYIRREKSLISLASHELRTPVAVIAGALDVLEQRGTLGDPDRRTLSRIRRATDEMRSDVDALLKLARRDSNQEESTSVNLAGCVGEVVADIEAFSPDTRGRITCRGPASPVRVRADHALVRMLLRNLIQNAVRHTRAGVEVHIQADRLVINDHGEGLPEQARSRLSEPSARQSVPEDGLGLFIVRLICERLGWRIATNSSGPSGTRIELQFDAGTAPTQTAPL